MMATTKKKPSAAQLAARKLFAQRAKAGTLKKTAKKNPARKTPRKAAPATKRAKRVEAVTHRAKSAGLSTIYIVESSKDGKRWGFVQAYQGPSAAKQSAGELADAYPLQYIRVRSEKLL